MPSTEPSTEPSRGPTAGAAVRIGLLLCALGLLAIVVDVVPFFFGQTDRPLWLNLSCLLLPVGLVVAVWSGVSRTRAEQRAAYERAQQLRQQG